jgi:cyclin H
VKLYVGKVAQLCGHLRFSEEVEVTAVSYLKQFYLKNTVMDWHPKNVMYVAMPCIYVVYIHMWLSRLTALFLAAKTTNNPISLDDHTSHIPKRPLWTCSISSFLLRRVLGSSLRCGMRIVRCGG